MKKITFLLLTICGMLCFAQEIKPLWDIKFNEGDFDAIKSTGTRQFTLKAQATEKLEWGEGRLGGKALYFNNDIMAKEKPMATVVVPTSEHYDFTKPFTAMCWMKVNKACRGDIQYTLFGNVPSDYGPGFRVIYGWGAIRALFGEGTPGKGSMFDIKNSKFPFEKDVWHHVAISYDGTTIRLFFNGIEGASLEKPIYPTKPRPFYFGSYNGYAYCYCGALQDFKLFDQALTPEQIMKIAKDMQ